MQKLLNLFRYYSLPKYLIAAIVIIVPLFPKFPLFNIPGTYVAVRFEDVLMLVLGFLTSITLFKNYKDYLKDPIVRSIVLFIFIGLISVLSGVLITKTISLHLALFHLIRRIEYIVPFFAIITLFDNNDLKNNLNYYIKLIIIVISVLFVYGVGQKYYSFPIIITQNQEYSKGVALRYTEGSHINSTFAGHYDLASYMVLILPIVISLIFLLKEKYSKLLLTLVAVFGLWLLVNSLSRIAQVSYLIAIFLTLGSIKKYKELIIVGLISLIMIGSSSGLYLRFSRFFTVYAQEEVHIVEDRSTNIRLVVEWPRAIRALSKNPLLGTGYSSINLATDNDYLRALGEVGILGFASFVLIIFNIVKTLVKSFPFEKHFSGLELGIVAGTFGGFIGTLVTAFFIDIFEASKFAITMWLMMGLSVFLIKNKLNDQKI